MIASKEQGTDSTEVHSLTDLPYAAFKNHMQDVADEHEVEEEVGMVDPTQMGFASGDHAYYRYQGSLTTPPCTEGVTWTIIKQVRSVSEKQVKQLRVAAHDGFETNARPTQPTNARCVRMYKPVKR